MKKFTTIKTLLVGLLACAATSAWAAVEVTETYDFYSFATGDGYITLSATEYTNGDETVYLANDITLGESTMKLSQRFAFDMVSYNNSDAWRFRNTGTSYQKGLVCQWKSGTGLPWRMSIVNLKADDKVTITYQIRSGKDANLKFANANVKSGETTVAVDGVMASGTEYTVVADGQIDLYVNDNNLAIHNVVIKTVGVETVSAPTIKEIGAKGSQRYVSMTSGTSTIGAEVSTYYTLNGDDPTSSSTLYTEPILVDGGVTVKAVSYSTGSTYSEISSLTTDNSGSLSLNAPAINVVNLTEVDGNYTLTISATSNNASVLGNPTATLSATFDGEDVTEAIVAGTFVPSKDGMLTVTAAADGYTTSNASATLAAYYTRSWQSLDFSSIIGEDAVKENLGEEWALITSGDYPHARWASWNKDKDGTYNFYNVPGDVKTIKVNDNISMRNVVVLAEGMGLGRNTTGGEAITITGAKIGDVVKFEVYNGYGNDIVKGTNTFFSYALNYGTTPALSSTNGALLVQAEIYSPVIENIEATIGDEGWATLYTDYALDFAGVEGLTAYTATLTDNTVTLTLVDNVPAGTGVVLQGASNTYEIPVAESSETAKGDLKGSTTTAKVADGNQYVLIMNNESNAQFTKATSGSIAAGKAYLEKAESESRILNVVFAGEATGIKAIETEQADGNIYNMAGQRVAAPQKGLFIMNGKKVIIK